MGFGNEIKKLRLDIAASLYIVPGTTQDLLERDFLHNRSAYGVDMMIHQLDLDGAIYYRGEVMHIKKKWAKKHLTEYEFDFG